LRICKIIKTEFIFFGNGIRPSSSNEELVRIARDLQRWIFERCSVPDELPKCLLEVAFLLFVLPSKEALLPNVGKTLSAAGLGGSFFKGEPFAGGIG